MTDIFKWINKNVIAKVPKLFLFQKEKCFLDYRFTKKRKSLEICEKTGLERDSCRQDIRSDTWIDVNVEKPYLGNSRRNCVLIN